MVSSKLMSPANRIQGFLGRNFWLILGVSSFVTFWMLVYTFVAYTPKYAAQSTVIIKDSAITSRYVEPDQYYALQTTSSSSSNPVLNTMGILKSNAISDALWNYFRTRHPEVLKQKKIGSHEDWNSFFADGSAFIKAKNQAGTDLITIQFAWQNKLIAKEGLEVIVKAFQETSRDLNKAEQVSRTQFLGKQVADLEAQVADIRRTKSDYQSKKKTVHLQREEEDLASSRMELTNRLNQLESQASGKETLARRYQQMLGMSSEEAMNASAVGQNDSMAKLQNELYRLEQLHSLLTASLTDTNPKVQEVQAQINRVKANIHDERVRTLGQTRGSRASNSGIVADSTRSNMIGTLLAAQGEAQDLRAQASIVRNRLAQVNHDIEQYPAMAEGLANIDQKEASLSAALNQLRQKVLEGHIKEDQTLSNVFVVDAPQLPDHAQFPTQTHLLVISVLLGLGTGLAVAFGKEQFLKPSDPQGPPSWLEPIDEDDDFGFPEDGDDLNDLLIPGEPGSEPDERELVAMRYGNERAYRQPLAKSLASRPRRAVPKHPRNLAEPRVSEYAQVSAPSIALPLYPYAAPQPEGLLASLTTDLLPSEAMQATAPEAIQPSTIVPPAATAQTLPPTPSPITVQAMASQPVLSPTAILDEDLATMQTVVIPPHGVASQALQAELTAAEEETAKRLSDAELAPPPIQPIATRIRTSPAPPAYEVQPQPLQTVANDTRPEVHANIPAMHAAPVDTTVLKESSQQADERRSDTPQRSIEIIPGVHLLLKDDEEVGPEETLSNAPTQTPTVAAIEEAPIPDTSISLDEMEMITGDRPRRTRSLPAFLLEEQELPNNPVGLNNLLTDNHDLSQEMAPIGAPADEAHLDEQRLPIPSFMQKQKAKSPRGFGRRVERNPQAFFGLGARKQKNTIPAGSLDRIMQSLSSQSIGHHPAAN